MISRRLAAGLTLLLTLAAAGCGSSTHATTPATTVGTTTTAAATVTISPADRPACTFLFARLQRVTIALQTSSDLIAHSLNKQQLARRIAIEQVQLQRSARLMAGGPVPAALAPANRDLVAALRAFSRDFGRAKGPAKQGDFRGATAAMTDRPVVQRILRASTTIERTCRLH